MTNEKTSDKFPTYYFRKQNIRMSGRVIRLFILPFVINIDFPFG
jgi:hypothetical protein